MATTGIHVEADAAELGFSAERLAPERPRLPAPTTIDFVANTSVESGREVLAL